MNFDKRNSNIEIIRIVAMFFIVGYHLLLHYVPVINGEEFLSAPMVNKIFSSFMYSGGGLEMHSFSL